MKVYVRQRAKQGQPYLILYKLGGSVMVSPSAFTFGTALNRFADEVALAVPDVTYVLVVPSAVSLGFELGGFLSEALLLQGFHGFAWHFCLWRVWVY